MKHNVATGGAVSAFDRMSAAEATELAKARFGPNAYAVAYRRRRKICRVSPGSLAVEDLGYGRSWTEAFSRRRH